MSSEEMATKMRHIINEFLKCLKQLAVNNCGKDFEYIKSKDLYENVFHLARHMHLYPKYRELFTDEDKKYFKEAFHVGFIKLIGYTPGMVNNIEDCDMNIAKTKLSEMTFLKNEIFELFKELNDGDQKLNSSEERAVEILDDLIEKTLDNVSRWSEPDYYSAIDDPEEVPNLNGVPESHSWWPAKHLEVWKNKTKNY